MKKSYHQTRTYTY